MAGRVAGLAGRVAAYIATHLAPRPCASTVSRAAARVVARSVPCRRALSIVSQPLAALYHDTTVALLLATIQFCIATQLPAARPLHEPLQQNRKFETTNCDHKKWSKISDHITTTMQPQNTKNKIIKITTTWRLHGDHTVTIINDHR